MGRHNTTYKKLIASGEWKRFAIAFKAAHPLCQWCLNKGRAVPARAVHHIIECETAHNEVEMRKLMFNPGNCVALCFKCHSDYHNGKGYHKAEHLEERQQQRHEQWKDALIKSFE